MESQPQNHEFRNNPENFHPMFCAMMNVMFLILLYRVPKPRYIVIYYLVASI